MREFKVGDIVKKADGNTFCNNRYTATVTEIRRNMADTSDCIWLDTDCWCYPHELKLVEDKTKWRKHHDLIVAWAKGAEIEWWDSYSKKWYIDANPTWILSTVYRIRSQKSDKDIEIEAIEAEMRKLADRVAELKGE